MHVFCGDAEVTPIHPFKLEQRVSESDAIYEGLYVFDPGALGPLSVVSMPHPVVYSITGSTGGTGDQVLAKRTFVGANQLD
jgi:hypothetical protein